MPDFARVPITRRLDPTLGSKFLLPYHNKLLRGHAEGRKSLFYWMSLKS